MYTAYSLVFIHVRMYIGLTDKVLESVVSKGSGELLSLDLSAVPHLLTDHALSVIGQYYHGNYFLHICMYVCICIIFR